ncbi:hypothetical protein GGI25_001668 [Coemansia spiralis]|uniref:MRN complex-interacting protein N-terminal domain-containing protein n=2 Tax=Coemansia TaxID=4863 RepID=A0A9W8GCE4_9FUNG|nr:hypothetical protein EDC05_005484 [Coemansia umbellata]KAJ2623900.1 hypothetical protein GGI26_001915 [Coemansia sp. RSA 1358]KAJ2679312.1 hypothetical protein GGI25_001668 [Coemansia spiralis]
MPNYQVVRCANDTCKFQTQQEKKTPKWTCVACGLKQSLRRVYFSSTVPKECRQMVMQLNMECGQRMAQKLENIVDIRPVENKPMEIVASESRWQAFEDPCELDDLEAVAEEPVAEEPVDKRPMKNRFDPYKRLAEKQKPTPGKKATADLQTPRLVRPPQLQLQLQLQPQQAEQSKPMAKAPKRSQQTTQAPAQPSKWSQYAYDSD